MSVIENPADQEVLWNADRLRIAMKVAELSIEPPMNIDEETAMVGMLNGQRPAPNTGETELRYAINTSEIRIKGAGMLTSDTKRDEEPRYFELLGIKRDLVKKGDSIAHHQGWHPISVGPTPVDQA